jgi:acyl-CoA oxidase
VLCAKLMIDGESYGVQFFIIQIRDTKNHQTLEGLEIGDLGTKYGYNFKDNGFIRFNSFRIPRENLVRKVNTQSYLTIVDAIL